MKKYKVEQLTSAQEAKLEIYTQEGIEIGLRADPTIDEKLVRELTDKHRVMCRLKPATNFLVFDSPMAVCAEIKGINTGNALYGQHDIAWLQHYMFFRRECELLEETEQIVYLHELTKHVGWMWMSSDTTVVTRRPAKLSLVSRKQANGSTLQVLHNPDGLAVIYADGNGVYVLNGLFVDDKYAKFITTPAEEIDVAEVLGIENVEIRTEVLKKIGVERALDKLDKTRLDSKFVEVGGTYNLFEVKFPTGQSRIYLQGWCPSSSKIFCEAVHPDCKTVYDALSWREDGVVDGENYTPPEART